jgi:hypothetical protein
MIPKIRIIYSSIYDQLLHTYHKKKFGKLHRHILQGEKYAAKLQKKWNKIERNVLTTMSKITKLEWKKKEIECYVVKHCKFSFSHPLTLIMRKNLDRVIVTLIHELAHEMFWSNRKKVVWSKELKPWAKKSMIYKKYKNEDYVTKLHLPVHALVILTCKRIFGKNAEKYLKHERFWERKKSPGAKAYKRSWEIVNEEGPKNILIDLIKSD